MVVCLLVTIIACDSYAVLADYQHMNTIALSLSLYVSVVRSRYLVNS